ncbi:EthD domain-containing protein [Rhizorhabdus argentea]|uniref:EthD domain-containing protein n=1 Tax=Rhizorhabdus argentea TaxID=1387174 RepID=UPI0030ECE730
MYKMMMFMKRKEGISFEQFRDHYENVHIPLCTKWLAPFIVDFKRYYPQNLINLYVGREDADQAPNNDGGVDYDAVSIYSVKDQAALDALLKVAQDPEFTRAVTADEANFVDRAKSRQTLVEEIAGSGLI